MVFFMGRRSDNSAALPPRIKAAFDYLDHVRMVSTQYEASIPARDLSPLEKSVQAAALRALQQYLLGEMDFAEPPAATKPAKREDDDGAAQSASGCPT